MKRHLPNHRIVTATAVGLVTKLLCESASGGAAGGGLFQGIESVAKFAANITGELLSGIGANLWSSHLERLDDGLNHDLQIACGRATVAVLQEFAAERTGKTRNELRQIAGMVEEVHDPKRVADAAPWELPPLEVEQYVADPHGFLERSPCKKEAWMEYLQDLAHERGLDVARYTSALRAAAKYLEKHHADAFFRELKRDFATEGKAFASVLLRQTNTILASVTEIDATTTATHRAVLHLRKELDPAHIRTALQELLKDRTDCREQVLAVLDTVDARLDTLAVHLRTAGDDVRRVASAVEEVPQALERIERRLGAPHPLGQRLFPPTLGQSFVDVEPRLKVIREHFLSNDGGRRGSVRPLAVVGTGGFGKTRAVAEFAHAHLNRYASQVWLRADSPSILLQQVAQLSASLVAQGSVPLNEEAQVEAALAQLPQLSSQGLLVVFDGADDEQTAKVVKGMVRRLGGAHVVITTRFQKWGASVQKEQLPSLDPTEAERYLVEAQERSSSVSPKEQSSIRDLASSLGYLPLALESAAAYVRAKETSYSNYFSVLQRTPADALQWRDELEFDYPLSVWKCFHTTWEQIRSESQYAYSILSISALLGLGPIPIAIWPKDIIGDRGSQRLQQWASGWDLRTSLLLLKRYSQVERVPGPDAAYELHPVIRTVLRATVPDKHLPEVLASPLDMLARALLAGDVEHPRVWAKWEFLRNHVESVVKDALQARLAHPTTALMNGLGNYFVARGAFAKAEVVLRHALHTDELAFGKETEDWLFLYKQPFAPALYAEHAADLAECLRRTERQVEAEELLRHAMKVADGLEDGHPTRTRLDHDLGVVLMELGRDAEAQEHVSRALTQDEESRASHDRAIARDLHSLGRLLMKGARNEEAEEVLCRAARAYRGCRNESPQRHVVGTVLGHLDGPRPYEESFRTTAPEHAQPYTMTMPKWVGRNYGRHIPALAMTLRTLASLRASLGRDEEAVRLLQRSLAILWYNRGPNHPETHATWNQLHQMTPLVASDHGDASYGGWVIAMLAFELSKLSGKLPAAE